MRKEGKKKMMDYCVKESTLNRDDEVVRDQTIKENIQETRKTLLEMQSMLFEFASIVNGVQKNEDKIQRDASSLWDEARLLTALAYENLQKLNEIKMSII